MWALLGTHSLLEVEHVRTYLLEVEYALPRGTSLLVGV